jgi:hypothetical protein
MDPAPRHFPLQAERVVSTGDRRPKSLRIRRRATAADPVDRGSCPHRPVCLHIAWKLDDGN